MRLASDPIADGRALRRTIAAPTVRQTPHGLGLLVLARMVREPEDRRFARDHVNARAFLVPEQRDLFHEMVERDFGGSFGLRTRLAERRAPLVSLLDQALGIPTSELEAAGSIAELVAALHLAAQEATLDRLLARAVAARTGAEGIDRIAQSLSAGLESLGDLGATDRSFDDWDSHLASFSRAIRDEAAGFVFGYDRLDAELPKSKPGQLMLIGAPSGGGKSTILRNFVLRWLRHGYRVALISCEMTADEQIASFVSMLTGIPLADVVEPSRTSEAQKQHMEDVARWLAASGLTINERGHQTPESCLAAMRRYADRGAQIIAIDHLHRLDYGERGGETDLRVQIGSFARELKSFAKDRRVFLPALVQLTKASEHDEPGPERIRESNKLLEEADRVLLSWLPLVACEQDASGRLRPIVDSDGRRRFKTAADDLPRWGRGTASGGATLWGPDFQTVYLKVGKQRLMKSSDYLAVPFDAATGLMYEGYEPHRPFALPSGLDDVPPSDV